MGRSVNSVMAVLCIVGLMVLAPLGCGGKEESESAQQRASIRTGVADAQQPAPGSGAPATADESASATPDTEAPPAEEAAPPEEGEQPEVAIEKGPGGPGGGPGGGQPGDRFKEADKNSDGVLTEDEAGAEAVGFMDGDKDGSVTQEEARAASEQMKAGQGDPFERFDKNKDGILSGDEVGAERLAGMDGNKDGKVTREEARQAFERRRAQGGPGGGGRGGQEDVFRRLDRNGDGKITKDETAEVPGIGEIMQKADSNKDGALSAEEAKAFMSQSGDRGGPGGQKRGQR